MRRREIAPWESEAQHAGERLRQALVVLLERERAFLAGAAEDETLLRSLDAVNRTVGSVDQWGHEWRARTADLKTSRAVVLSVFRGCLPPLLGAVDVYSRSLTIVAISPELGAGDEDLAGQGIRAAKDVSSVALQFLDDIPAIRPVDRAAVDATLAGLQTRSAIMFALGDPIGRRMAELRNEGGYGRPLSGFDPLRDC